MLDGGPTLQEKLYKTTIALAGIMQALNAVRELAQTGKTDTAAFETCIYSIFQTNPANTTDVYGGIEAIKPGIEKLIAQLGTSPNPALTRYMLSLMHLQKKVSHSTKLLNTLAKRIDHAKTQVTYFSLTHPTVIANLADIYLTTISTFKFRVIIWGNQRILSVGETMEKIRALLLAGVRSSVLWRQSGGSRFQLIFSRAKILAAAKEILLEIEQKTPIKQKESV